MQRHSFLILGLICCGLVALPAGSQEKAKKDEAKADAKEQDTDITARVRTMNSDESERPPTQFRPGKVTPAKLDDKARSTTDKGFTIQLPGGAPIPTPTVYKGKIYVSGGFQTRQFYCFDAGTGKLVWTVELDDDGPTSAVCENDICVFNTESCTIFALDAHTGKHLWSHFLGDPLTSTPTIAGGKVFTSYPAGGGMALNNALPGGPANPMQMAQNGMGKGGGKDKKAGLPIPPPTIAPPPAPNIPTAPNPPVQGDGKADAKKGEKKDAEDLEKLKELAKGPQVMPGQPQQMQPRSNSHVLACLDLKTGKILWQRWIDSDVMSAPVAVSGDVYATSFAGTVYRFSQDKGTILSAHSSRATSAPVVVGSNVYMTKRADSGKDGKVQEQIASANRQLTGPTYDAPYARDAAYLDDRVQKKSEQDKAGKEMDKLNGFGGGAPAAANPDAAAKNVGQANVSTMQSFQGSRILNFQSGNFNCMGNEVVCTDPANGKVKWSLKLEGDLEKLGGFLASPPAAAGGSLFLATVQGEVLRVDPANGKILEKFKIGSPLRTQPAIDGGRIYVGTQDGKVVCIDTGNPQFTGWSTWGANSAHTNIVDKK